MDAAEIVTALRARDPDGLAAAYDAYADRLLAYCAGMLRDRDAAADAVHDSFVIAFERADQLRDPDRLRAWLYAIARNECLRVLRGRQRSAELDEAAAVSDQAVDVDAGLREEELRRLVWAAAEGLNPREREVLDLAVRHDLDVSEVARALGVPGKHVHALLSKARQQLERAVAVLIVVRTGRRDCPELSALIGDWDGSLTVLLRKRVARHIEGCGICAERRRRDVNAEALFAAVPLMAAPVVLRDDILAVASSADDAARVAIADSAGRFDRSGFPVPLDRTRRRGGLINTGPAIAAVLIAAAVVGGVLFAEHQRAGSIVDSPPVAPTVEPTEPASSSPERPVPPTGHAPTPAGPPATERPALPSPVRTSGVPGDPGDERRTQDPVRPTSGPTEPVRPTPLPTPDLPIRVIPLPPDPDPDQRFIVPAPDPDDDPPPRPVP